MSESPDVWRRVNKILEVDQQLQREIDRIWKRLDQYPEPQGIWFNGHPNGFHNWATTTTTSTTTVSGCPCETSGAWEFAVSGINTIAACGGFNRSYSLASLGAGVCGWRESYTSSGLPYVITLLHNSYLGRWELSFESNGSVRSEYALSSGGWDCDGPNVMSQIFVGGCDGWPSTITVTRV